MVRFSCVVAHRSVHQDSETLATTVLTASTKSTRRRAQASVVSTMLRLAVFANLFVCYHFFRRKESSLSVRTCVALTNIPEGELLTGFAMRSDPNVVFG